MSLRLKQRREIHYPSMLSQEMCLISMKSIFVAQSSTLNPLLFTWNMGNEN